MNTTGKFPNCVAEERQERYENYLNSLEDNDDQAIWDEAWKEPLRLGRKEENTQHE